MIRHGDQSKGGSLFRVVTSSVKGPHVEAILLSYPLELGLASE